jgi:hypothetical protein
MAPGVRAHFEQRLAQLNEDVLQMGTLARRAVARGLQALVDSDQDLAREVIVEDVSLNRLRFELESQCYALLATEQPVASDMRVIVARQSQPPALRARVAVLRVVGHRAAGRQRYAGDRRSPDHRQ